MPAQFADVLERGPMLSDGAMGTQLYERGGVVPDACLDELNLTDPELVKSVHLDYIRAGSQVIETNTFGANRMRLTEHRLEGKVAEINSAAVRIAREAQDLTGQRVWIAGAIGPLGRHIAPVGPVSLAQARQAFVEQVQALHDATVDFLALETFPEMRELREAVGAVKEVSTLPLIAQMTFTEDGTTSSGESPVEVVRTLEDLDVQGVGTNCGIGSEPLYRVVEEMAGATELPISAQPNAGFPTYRDGRFIYLSSPEYVAQHARRMVEAGVTMLGGCCGTSPQHIAAIRDALHGARPRATRRPERTRVRKPRASAPAPRVAEPTALSQKLGRKFVVTVEVDPPKGFDVSPDLEALSGLKETGFVDTINVADSPRAQSAMCALAMSSLIQGRLGMETIMHIALRHRNLVALHSELLGAHALGVRNVFVVMGDLPRSGDYPSATSISDITASGAISLIKAFNSGVDLSGRPIEQQTSFVVGCAFNPGAKDLDRELKVLDRKIEAGADFVLTQPVYAADTVERARQRLGGFPVPVLVGVLPLRSHRHAEFLHNEVPGMELPDEVRDRIRLAGRRAPEVGIEVCRELLGSVQESVSGAYFIPPFGRYDTVALVLEGLNVSPGGPRGEGAIAAFPPLPISFALSNPMSARRTEHRRVTCSIPCVGAVPPCLPRRPWQGPQTRAATWMLVEVRMHKVR